ncbi:hypothetical protein DUI87_25270 [Hirundo rustica rustica]|uniref:Uncharacterized protein n=1 Tax=Hirundo rustica rustica TaxID=333673 RepID=A0A3M0JC35_HIRRU|nr:hypothetical protein DUI87_25270 [Hirundo rustica rustica]
MGEQRESNHSWRKTVPKYLLCSLPNVTLNPSVQKLGERSPASIPLCPIIFYLVGEEIIYDSERTSTIGTGISPHWLFVTPQTSGNINGQVLLSETLAKLEIPDFQTLDLQIFVVHETTVRGARHKPVLNADLRDHRIVERMMRLLG